MEAYIDTAEMRGDQFVILFSGCDYKCRYCNVPHLVEFQTGQVMETKEVAHLIDEAAPATVFFSGGEPLLQRQALIELLRHAKRCNTKTIVDTNASKPEAIRTLLDESLVDEFIVDVKAPMATFDKVTKASTFFKPAAELFDEFTASIALLRAAKKSIIRFKTVIAPGLLYKKEDLLAIAAMLDGFDAEWQLAPFNPERTLDPTLKGVAPPTEKFLATLQGFIQKEYPRLRVTID